MIYIATGSMAKQLEILEKAVMNSKGVFYCAVCDARAARNKDVMVVGGGGEAR